MQIVRPINAYLVVDVQNDFISGSLNISNCAAQQNGLEVRTKGMMQIHTKSYQRGMSDEHRLNVYLLSLLFLYFSLISGDFDAMEIFNSDSKNLCFSFNLAKSALKTVN